MGKKINITILIAPLDWGLGHATRCIPLIKHLVQSECNIVIAASGYQEKLLKIEFPSLTFVSIQPYNIQYPVNKRLFSIKIALQIPKIIRAILLEHHWLKRAVSVYNIDAIISDNRYGLWHKRRPSIFITHQLQPHIPIPGLQNLVRLIHYKLIRKFSACWIPDSKEVPSLAGKLSHPTTFPNVPVEYLGSISRFKKRDNVNTQYYLLVVISGPEPQRTILERKIVMGLQQFNRSVLLVRGLPGSAETLPSMQNVTIENHLPAKRLEEAFAASEYIISRSGYTTVMDIVALGKKSILIPTPGQTEQEYLADHLMKQQLCLSISQDKFDLQAGLQQAENYSYQFPYFDKEAYKIVLKKFVERLQIK